MGTGYTRADTANNIADGNVINAADLDSEFDAVEAAFATTGHTHDGTAAEGGPVSVTGPAQEYVSDGTALYPKTDDTYDLGKSGSEWKDLYVDGTAYIDSLVAGIATVNGDFTVGGSILPSADYTYNLGSEAASFDFAFIRRLRLINDSDEGISFVIGGKLLNVIDYQTSSSVLLVNTVAKVASLGGGGSGTMSVSDSQFTFTTDDGTQRIIRGTGSPEGSVNAVVGSFYVRSDGGTGTTFYVKESGTGNTGWVAK